MHINWNKNPLYTTINVDDHDRKMILNYIQQEEYTNILCGLDLDIKSGHITSLEEAHKEIVKWGDICNLTIESEEVQAYVEDLQHNHVGDCTCFATSCFKCMAEEAIGVNTIAGLGKHEANKIMGAFGKDNENTIDEAIRILEEPSDYVKPDTWPDSAGWDSHVPRWKSEKKNAVKWLKAYKERHGF